MEWSKNMGSRNNSTFSSNNSNYNFPSPFASPQSTQRNQFYNNAGSYATLNQPSLVIDNRINQPLLPPSFQQALTEDTGGNTSGNSSGNSRDSSTDTRVPGGNDDHDRVDNVNERFSYYMSSLPLYCSDWSNIPEVDTECIALSSYKEGFQNKLHILHGLKYGKEATVEDYHMEELPSNLSFENDIIEGFDFHKVSEINVDYPITKLQWDPMVSKIGNLTQRLAASSEVLRLYKVDHENYETNGDYQLIQTHYLTNNNNNHNNHHNNHHKGDKDVIMTNPPVTSFDWNRVDNSILITSSVDTTCTVWDLNRSVSINDPANQYSKVDSATVKTQLIAHDSEVFDVKFLHDSTNLFASVGNDGSMRIFDLRSLEHSTIIYEPSNNTNSKGNNTTTPSSSGYSSKALIKLDTSNIDQHYLATIGVNSNQIIIIDTRMPGLPIAILDASFEGLTNSSINAIKWHPNSNFLLTGGDDCQSLIWDCNNLYQSINNKHNLDTSLMINSPVMAYQDNLEVNNVCWRGEQGDWMGVVSGKGFQAVSI